MSYDRTSIINLAKRAIFHQVQKGTGATKKQIEAFNQVLAGTPVRVEDQPHKRIKREVTCKAQSRSSRLAAASAASLEQASPTIDWSAHSREEPGVILEVLLPLTDKQCLHRLGALERCVSALLDAERFNCGTPRELRRSNFVVDGLNKIGGSDG
jgi:hypothetical protein